MIQKISIGVLILSVTLFIFQNARSVNVRFAAWGFDGSLSIVLIVVFLAGMLTATFLFLGQKVKRKKFIQESFENEK